MPCSFSASLLIFSVCNVGIALPKRELEEPHCDDLLSGQYVCYPILVSPETDQPMFCDWDHMATVLCVSLPGLRCQELINGTFIRRTDVRCSGTKSFKIALTLSIFFGWAGLDRFYLGYITLGLFKLCTFGFFFLFHLLDIILIALQIVQPGDGTAYSMDYHGPRVHRVFYTNRTHIRPTDN